MILVSANVSVVFNRSQPQTTKLGPHLQAHFSLQCLFCGLIYKGESNMMRIKKDERPAYYISHFVTYVKQTRSCSNCGIVSALPELDDKKFRKALERVITVEFIEEHWDDQPPIFAQRLMDRAKLSS